MPSVHKSRRPATRAAAGASAGPTRPATACTALYGVVRDFRWGTRPAGIQILRRRQVGDEPGIVATTLGPDNKPVYAATGRQPQKSTTGPDTSTNGTTMSRGQYVVCLGPADGRRQWDSLFPSDQAQFFLSARQCWLWRRGTASQFSFTTEIHTAFQYKGVKPSRSAATTTSGCSSTSSWSSIWEGDTPKRPRKSPSIHSDFRKTASTSWRFFTRTPH